jgi:hypothetical protein
MRKATRDPTSYAKDVDFLTFTLKINVSLILHRLLQLIEISSRPGAVAVDTYCGM